MHTEQHTTYTSRDFYLSAYLIATGAELLEFEKDGRGLTTFIFRNSETVNDAVRRFYNLEALVNPVSYGNALRNLKSIIHGSDKSMNTTHTVNRTTSSTSNTTFTTKPNRNYVQQEYYTTQ